MKVVVEGVKPFETDTPFERDADSNEIVRFEWMFALTDFG